MKINFCYGATSCISYFSINLPEILFQWPAHLSIVIISWFSASLSFSFKHLSPLRLCVISRHWSYPGKDVFHLKVTWPGQRCVHKYLAQPYIAGQRGAGYKNTQVEAGLQRLCCSFSGHHVMHSFCFHSFSSIFCRWSFAPWTRLIKDTQCQPIILDFDGHKSKLTNKNEDGQV